MTELVIMEHVGIPGVRPLPVELSHEAVMRMMLIANEKSVPALLPDLVASLCQEGLQPLFEAFVFDQTPLLTEAVGQDGPHLFAHVVVCLGQVADFGAVPRVGSVALLDQALISLAASIGSLAGKFEGDRLPVETLLSSLEEFLIAFG